MTNSIFVLIIRLASFKMPNRIVSLRVPAEWECADPDRVEVAVTASVCGNLTGKGEP